MFSDRLREERKRLDLNQEDFGKACGVRKQAQIKYESGDRSPKSDYLERASKLGVDVGYIITGVRTSPINLPPDEAFLLDSFRSLNAQQKKIALQFLLGGIENMKEDADVAPTTDNSKNQGVIGDTEGGVTIDRSVDNSSDNASKQGVFDSPNSTITGSFNTESGFTELVFIKMASVCGGMAWLLAEMANYKATTDALVSLSFGSLAIILWVVTMIIAILGYETAKREARKGNKTILIK